MWDLTHLCTKLTHICKQMQMLHSCLMKSHDVSTKWLVCVVLRDGALNCLNLLRQTAFCRSLIQTRLSYTLLSCWEEYLQNLVVSWSLPQTIDYDTSALTLWELRQVFTSETDFDPKFFIQDSVSEIYGCHMSAQPLWDSDFHTRVGRRTLAWAAFLKGFFYLFIYLTI